MSTTTTERTTAAEFGDPRLPKRLWAMLAINEETDCWEWTGYLGPTGYANTRWAGKTISVHRLAYRELVGDLPKWTPGGIGLDHLCRRRNCANPAHLDPVSQQENVLRGTAPAALQASLTHCQAGHELAGDNLRANGRHRVCRTCRRASGRRYAEAFRAVRAALSMPHGDYLATFGGSLPVAERIVAAVESGIAPESIVANARAAHKAIRAENVDAWINALANTEGTK